MWMWNLILSQLKLDWRNLNGKNDAQKVKPDLNLGQVVEVRRRFSALAIPPCVLLQVVEKELSHRVLFLCVHWNLQQESDNWLIVLIETRNMRALGRWKMRALGRPADRTFNRRRTKAKIGHSTFVRYSGHDPKTGMSFVLGQFFIIFSKKCPKPEHSTIG